MGLAKFKRKTDQLTLSTPAAEQQPSGCYCSGKVVYGAVLALLMNCTAVHNSLHLATKQHSADHLQEMHYGP